MKAEELRIGNIVSQYHSFGVAVPYWRDWEIAIGDDINHVMGNPDKYKGIPLTEEWLVRFGAKPYDLEIDSFVLYSITCDYRFFKSTLIGGDVYWTCEKVLGDTNIEYVHQLQNIYFALTGQELTINPSL